MPEAQSIDWRPILAFLGIVALVSVTLAALLFAAVHRRLRKIRVPSGADFFTTVRAVPLGLVVGIDLLDLGLESFSAPLIWFILNRYKLQALRNVATVEALIPVSGPIPTLTIAWLAHAVGVAGDRPRALRILGQLDELNRTRYVSRFHWALAWIGVGDHDKAFAALSCACDERDPALMLLTTEPRFDVLRGDPRYGAVIDRLGLDRESAVHV